MTQLEALTQKIDKTQRKLTPDEIQIILAYRQLRRRDRFKARRAVIALLETFKRKEVDL